VPKIHFHSDCEFFAGSENMLANLFGSPELRTRFELSFSYRATPRYTEGLRQRTPIDFPIWPLDLPNFDTLALPVSLARLRPLSVLRRQLVYAPLLAREVKQLHAVLEEVRPDIVHINNGGYPGALSCRAMALAARKAGVKKILMVVNNLAVPYDRVSRWMDWPLDRRAATVVDLFITGSSAAGKQLRSVLRLPASKIRPIHNGIRPRTPYASFEQTRQRLGLTGFDGLVLGVVALHEERKGHSVLLHALAQLVSQGRPAKSLKVLIEGDGPLLGELQEQCKQLGLTDIVRFTGVEAHVFDFMAAIDALILPSVRDEDFPNVILEAMSLAKPVIATRLAGIPEQVEDGVTGLLTAPGDAAQLTQAIARLAADPTGRRAMGQAARQRFASHFASDIALDNYLRLYQEMTSATQLWEQHA
jgi:L-malate glycosyltransferase